MLTRTPRDLIVEKEDALFFEGDIRPMIPVFDSPRAPA